MAGGEHRVVLAGARRTPIGSFLGTLSGVPATRLGATAIQGALKASGVSAGVVGEVIFGNVLSAGLGQAPARQAALYAGLPNSVEAVTVNKMCGSGLKAVMLAAQSILSGDAEVIIAGGMENMSRAPYLLPKGRSGHRLGHGEVVDSVIHDGLWDIYNDQHMGRCAELCGREFHFSRERQDAYARESYARSQAASNGVFAREIVAVEANGQRVEKDEEPLRADFEKMARLKPVFETAGAVTAANSSKISDGAAAVVVMEEKAAARLGVTPAARILSQASVAQAPEWFTTAPAAAIRKALVRASLSLEQIDLFEINEAFAVVALAALEELGLDPALVNVHGGAVSLGHPIGASGARILVTLLNAMEVRKVRRGVAAICIGGGEASALVVERWAE